MEAQDFQRLPAVPGPGLLGLALLAVLAGGCVSHEARIDNPSGSPTASLIGSKLRSDTPVEVVESSPLPIDLRISCWRRDEPGYLYRYEGRCLTPLPWWQRFPVDLATDVLPWTYTATASDTIACAQVPLTDTAELIAAARRDGYARLSAAPAPATDQGPQRH